jgi:branched-subunit amino acid transport protein AzlD
LFILFIMKSENPFQMIQKLIETLPHVISGTLVVLVLVLLWLARDVYLTAKKYKSRH